MSWNCNMCNCTNVSESGETAASVMCGLLSLVVLAQFVITVLLWLKIKGIIKYDKNPIQMTKSAVNSVRTRIGRLLLGGNNPRPQTIDMELGNNIYNTTNHMKRQVTTPASCAQLDEEGPCLTRADPRSKGNRSSERSRASQRSKGHRVSQRSKGSQRKPKIKQPSEQQVTAPPPAPPKPDSDVVFAAYSIAGPTGIINPDISLPTPATVPVRDPDDMQNAYDDPMQPEQIGNNVIFTGYALARRASESGHNYQYLETPAATPDILRTHQGLAHSRPVSTIQQQPVVNGKIPPVVPRRREQNREEQPKPTTGGIRKSGSSPDFQLNSTVPAITLQAVPAKKTNTTKNSNQTVAEPLSLLKRSPIEPLLSPQRKTKPAVPLPQKLSTPARSTPTEPRPHQSRDPATPPTVLVLHNPTYFDVVPGSTNGKPPVYTGKSRPAPHPPKPGTAERYEKELPPLPKPVNDRYKMLPPFPKTGTLKNNVRPPGAAP